jgi:hypothetical protein
MNSIRILDSKEFNRLKRINEDNMPFEHRESASPRVTSGTNDVIQLAMGLKPFYRSTASIESNTACTGNCFMFKIIFY